MRDEVHLLEAPPAELGFHMPAEWEPHAATWLTWPCSEDWPGKLESVRWVFCEIVRLLVKYERVWLIVQDGAVRELAQSYLTKSGVVLDSVSFFEARTDRTWARDNLPTFVVNPDSEQLAAVKWRFNGWARYPDHELDEIAGMAVAEEVARSTGGTVFVPRRQRGSSRERFVLEGGAIDVDGEGTLLTTRQCLLGKRFQRNPGLEQAQVERILQQCLGVSNIVWLEDGIAGDDTSGHVDDFARFVAPGQVVLCESHAADEEARVLHAAYEMLSSSTDALGRRLQVIRLPMPEPVVYDGERLPASYANFYICNHAVLVPTFNDPADYTALGILADLFPEREVIGVYARDLVVGLGTLHCSTQQMPAVVKKVGGRRLL